jgi:hypothetical protein
MPLQRHPLPPRDDPERQQLDELNRRMRRARDRFEVAMLFTMGALFGCLLTTLLRSLLRW